MKGKQFQTLLFDLDGTLVDSRIDLANAVNFSLKMTGQKEQSEEKIIPHVGNGLRVLLSEVMGPVSADTLQKATEFFSTFYEHHCVDNTVLYDDVEEILGQFSKRLKIGVVTNKPLYFADKILIKLKVKPFLSVVLGGDSLPERKPHPAPILKAIEQVNGAVPTTLMVGDGTQDMEAGKAAGVFTCAARYGYGFNLKLLKMEPTYSINRFNELKEIVL